MHPLAVLVLAIAPTASQPPTQGIVSGADYPQAALARNEQGSVYFEVVVDPQGKVDSCKVLRSSGFKDLDDATCRLVISRARFAPAYDDHQMAIYGTYRQQISWRINSRAPAPVIPSDLELTINRAPDGVRLPAQITVSYSISANGIVSDCKLSGDSKPASQALAELACARLVQRPIKVIRNHNNEPVDAQDTVKVGFDLDKR